MRIQKYILLIPLVIIFLSACEEDFNPYGEFREAYVFNCIIRGDTTYQMATLDRNYVTGSLNPYENHTDPAVKGAAVKMWYGDSVKVFKAGELPRGDTSRYTTPYSFYYSENFEAPQNTLLELEVLLPNGKKLNAVTNVPGAVTISRVESDQIIPPADRDYVKMRWNLDKTNQVYVPVLNINYFKRENGVDVRYQFQVPVAWGEAENQYLPEYPPVSTEVALIYEMDVIDIAMEQIAAGDPNKGDYTILAATFEVFALDDDLSTYYAATNVSNSGFSIKLDETDFTNIDGGYGIFGSYTKSRFASRFTHDYIRSFGYVPGLTE